MSATTETTIRTYRLVEWETDLPRSEIWRQAVELRAAMLAGPNTVITGLPPIEIAAAEDYAAARDLKDRIDHLFMSLPAIVRSAFSNDACTFLRKLRDRTTRDALALENLMLFEGEEPPNPEVTHAKANQIDLSQLRIALEALLAEKGGSKRERTTQGRKTAVTGEEGN